MSTRYGIGRSGLFVIYSNAYHTDYNKLENILKQGSNKEVMRKFVNRKMKKGAKR